MPDEFKSVAGNHAGTYWDIQEGGGYKPKPPPEWTRIGITPEHWAAGAAHLEGSNRKQMDKFGDQALGFAAEHAVADWFSMLGVEHHHDPDPLGTDPDFTIRGLTVDLKSVSSKGGPRKDYDANLAERQRLKDAGKINWYLFGKYDNTTEGNYYVLGFQSVEVILGQGVFYRKGDITRKKMKAPVDCWCIEYGRLIKPLEWLSQMGVEINAPPR